MIDALHFMCRDTTLPVRKVGGVSLSRSISSVGEDSILDFRAAWVDNGYIKLITLQLVQQLILTAILQKLPSRQEIDGVVLEHTNKAGPHFL